MPLWWAVLLVAVAWLGGFLCSWRIVVLVESDAGRIPAPVRRKGLLLLVVAWIPFICVMFYRLVKARAWRRSNG